MYMSPTTADIGLHIGQPSTCLNKIPMAEGFYFHFVDLIKFFSKIAFLHQGLTSF